LIRLLIRSVVYSPLRSAITFRLHVTVEFKRLLRRTVGPNWYDCLVPS